MRIFFERHSTVPGSQGLPIRFHFVTVVMMFSLVVSGGGVAAQQSAPTAQPSLPSTLKTLSSPGEISPRTASETVCPQESSAKTTVAQESTSSRAVVPLLNPANQADSSSAVDPTILSEIKAIRAQLGGGVAKQLEGVLEHPGVPGTPPSTNADSEVSGRLLLENVFDDEIKQLAGIQVSSQKPIEPPAEGNPSAAIRFRMAARYLDLAAAELEEVSRFVEADQLRQHAQRLRLQAR